MSKLAGEGRVEKRFRVAREGQTVDGRELTRQEIQEMADSYNPDHYGGRINIEHWAGFSPEAPFNAYGDIIKVEAVEESGKLCLYNTISALPNFIAMNQKGQKIYPSIEFYRNFAGTGKAYQVGLGLTDNPASLGTEPIKFSQNNSAVRTTPDKEIFMSNEAQQDENKSLLQQMKEFLTPQPKSAEDDELQTVMQQSVVSALNGIRDLNQKFTNLKSDIQRLSTPQANTPASTPQANTPASVPSTAEQDNLNNTLQQLTNQMTQMQQQLQTLSNTPVNQPPPANGNTGDVTPY